MARPGARSPSAITSSRDTSFHRWRRSSLMARRMAMDIAHVRNRLRPSNCGSRSRMRTSESCTTSSRNASPKGAMRQRPPQAAQEWSRQVHTAACWSGPVPARCVCHVSFSRSINGRHRSSCPDVIGSDSKHPAGSMAPAGVLPKLVRPRGWEPRGNPPPCRRRG